MTVAFLLQVQLSWGPKRDYLLANDVELGLLHRYQTRENWQEVIVNALINVPVAPYLPDDRFTPPISTAKVVSVKAIPITEIPDNIQRTRSQFIMAVVWQKQSAEVNYNFLHHDYSQWTQRQIRGDVDYWCNRHPHHLITLVTKWRCWRQQCRLQRLNHKNSRN